MYSLTPDLLPDTTLASTGDDGAGRRGCALPLEEEEEEAAEETDAVHRDGSTLLRWAHGCARRGRRRGRDGATADGVAAAAAAISALSSWSLCLS
jgi:hypothetical protein